MIKKHKISVEDCDIINLPRIKDRAGNITPIHEQETIPFKISRIFYLYDIPGGVDRGAHAHKTCHQFLVAASGSFEVELNDGLSRRNVLLNRPYYGLHIPPGIWAAEVGFSSGAICLVIASHCYDEKDYIRDFSEYVEYLNSSEI